MALRYDLAPFRAQRLDNGFLQAEAHLTRVGVFEYRFPDGRVRRALRLTEEVVGTFSRISSGQGTAEDFENVAELTASFSTGMRWFRAGKSSPLVPKLRGVFGKIGEGLKGAGSWALDGAKGLLTKGKGVWFSWVDDAAGGGPALRQQYVDTVAGLAERVPGMRQSGMSSEQIGRALQAERRGLGVTFKDLTPAEKLAEIHARNLQRYGDKLGPSIEWLRNAGKSWDDIIESATRAGGKDVGF